MKNKILCALCCVLVFVLVGCSVSLTDIPLDGSSETQNQIRFPTVTPTENPTENPTDTPTDTPDVPDNPTFGRENENFYEKFSAEERALYYTLWDEKSSVQVKIDITPYELTKINEAYLDYESHGRSDSTKVDTYRKCNLTITVNGRDYYYEEVGIRMRGNTSRRDFCNNDGLMYSLVHFRFSFDETFDGEEYAEGSWGEDIRHDWTGNDAARKARKKRTFATMEKLYFKWNKNYDNTYIREVYANKMFRANGIYAPNITLTQLSITQNGNFESVGVGGLYETIDKKFIERNFDEANTGGDLYKCTYRGGRADLSSASNYGVETPTQIFTYALKTNNDREAPDYGHNAHLKALINALSADKNSTDFQKNLEAVVDMEYFARFEAVNYLLGNPDCIRNNYNNYYLYFTPSGKAYFIPYDYDRCLGITVDWNPDGNAMSGTFPFSIKDSSGGDISNPLYRKTILSGGIAKYKNMYAQNLREVLDGEWFTYEHFLDMYNSYKATYEKYARPSDVIIQNCKDKLRVDSFVFNTDGAKDFSSRNENVSVSDYIRSKRAAAEKGI